MIRLAVKVTDIGAAVHVGGDPTSITYIFAIDNTELEELFRNIRDKSWTTYSVNFVSEEN